MQSPTSTSVRKATPGMTEWGSKARKAEAKARKASTRRAAITEAREG